MQHERLTQSQVDEVCRENFLRERRAEGDRWMRLAAEAEDAEDYGRMSECRRVAQINYDNAR